MGEKRNVGASETSECKWEVGLTRVNQQSGARGQTPETDVCSIRAGVRAAK